MHIITGTYQVMYVYHQNIWVYIQLPEEKYRMEQPWHQPALVDPAIQVYICMCIAEVSECTYSYQKINTGWSNHWHQLTLVDFTCHTTSANQNSCLRLKNLSVGYWSELHYPDLTSSPPEDPGLSITPISLSVYANKLNLFWLIHLNPNGFTG